MQQISHPDAETPILVKWTAFAAAPVSEVATYEIVAHNTDGPSAPSRQQGTLRAAITVVANLTAEGWHTILVWRLAHDGHRTLVCRYDVDGFDL